MLGTAQDKVGVVERHEAVDLAQLVQTVGWLVVVAVAGFVLQVRSLNKDPRGFADCSRGRLLEVESDDKIHGDVFAAVQLLHHGVHNFRLVQVELQVATVQEGAACQHRGVSAVSGLGGKVTNEFLY